MLSTLAAQSFFYYRPALLLHLCDYIAQNKITVDKFFLRKLETSLDKIKRKIVDFVSLPATIQTNSNLYKNIFFLKEKNYSRTERDGVVYYKRLTNFYNQAMPFFESWKTGALLQEQRHPYEKFARENDKLFHSYVKRTQNLKKREEVL